MSVKGLLTFPNQTEYILGRPTHTHTHTHTAERVMGVVQKTLQRIRQTQKAAEV